jgi:hypothetical protein
VEKLFGHGVYNRLRILPDLPVTRVRELGRFVKNQRLGAFDERAFRAPIEAGAALLGLLIGPLNSEIEACVGDIEEGGARRNIEFFHIPHVLLHGVMPYASDDAYLRPHVQSSIVYPFALLVSDLAQAIPRLDAIERALHLSGKAATTALLKLRQEPRTLRSSLEPAEGLLPLSDAPLRQAGVAMGARKRVLDRGEWLRTIPLFQSLSSAEAAVLGTFFERRTAAAGEVVVRRGEPGDALYLIESGQAEVLVGPADGAPSRIAELGPGGHFGEIALVAGGGRTADVVAAGPLALLRLTRDSYDRYLAHLVEVDRQLTRSALERTRAMLKATRPEA